MEEPPRRPSLHSLDPILTPTLHIQRLRSYRPPMDLQSHQKTPLHGLEPLETSEQDPTLHLATIAGGCFWGLELAYQRVPGVVYTAVGYSQGRETQPNYDQVCSGATGHTESVVVYYRLWKMAVNYVFVSGVIVCYILVYHMQFVLLLM